MDNFIKSNYGYSEAGASRTKKSMRGFTAKSSSPAEDINENQHTLRQRGRMLYMAAPIATAAININRTKIVGSGLHLKCAINNDVLGMSEKSLKKWQQKTEAEWQLWASKKLNCDALGMNDFYELQQLAVKAWLMSGDVFTVLKRTEPTALNPYGLRLHIVEADRVCTPQDQKAYTLLSTEGTNKNNGNKIYDGVEVDSDGKVVAYHICNQYPEEFKNIESREWTRVEVIGEKTGLPNIIQVMSAERPDQYRGVTLLAPVIEPILQIRRYTESELVAAIIQSFLTGWIVTESDTTEMPLSDAVENEFNEPVPSSDNEYEMGPGSIIHLKPGEKVQFGEPKIPAAGFESFVQTISRMIGAALEIPYDVLLKAFNASYSASKGALEEAWETVRMKRQWFVNDFCQPIYEVWLTEAVASGRIKAPGFFENPLIREAYCKARWDGPSQNHLDPKKEAEANAILVSHGWKTNEQITREHYGGSWEENIVKLLQEVKRTTQINQNSNKNRKADESNEE